MEELNQICSQLDQEILEYLELIETYQSQRKRTNFLLHNGFLELAHTKYVLGPGKVSRFQYDKRMQASTHVNIISDELIDLENPDLTKLKFVVTTNNINSKEDENIKEAGERPIRQRSKQGVETQTDLSTSYNKLDKEGDNKIELKPLDDKKTEKIRKDPINWFGVLSPPSLKNSQINFEQATLELSSLANLVISLNSRESKIKSMKKRKKELIRTLNNA